MVPFLLPICSTVTALATAAKSDATKLRRTMMKVVKLLSFQIPNVKESEK